VCCNAAGILRVRTPSIHAVLFLRARRSSLEAFQVAVLGDLHLEPDQMPLFHEARQQLLDMMSSPDGKLSPGARVVQVGGQRNRRRPPRPPGGAAAC
jgi:hypothetical protein